MTAAGPVHIAHARCLVMPGNGDEMLIGNDLMVSLGIDVNRMLEQLATPSSIEASSDPFPFPDEDNMRSDELDAIFKEQVASAVRAGMKPDLAEQLRNILHEFKDSYLGTLRVFFSTLREYNLKLSASKSQVYRQEVAWCGKLISGTTVRHDPERLSGLSNMPLPGTVQQLQHFLCAVGWLRDSHPDYVRVSLPLHTELDALLKLAGRRNKNALQASRGLKKRSSASML
ncbi:hypothetical protein P43SY_012084 [Pythium insidiosum]|uniref:Reverse transcriptase n=1 Tax=Pythium insidiosum TaxID=114742 RepID=A0AAD5LR12_PYTIN|nr:hypothetical protein P43SY_012084 [Pythium insidiosum]